MGEVRFMISEAAKQVHVESHVLRYWEEELNLKIGRTEMGHRYYTEDDIQLFLCIRKLKNEGMLLRDLKPLIPQLTATRKKLTDAVHAEDTPEQTSDTMENTSIAAADNTGSCHLEQYRAGTADQPKSHHLCDPGNGFSLPGERTARRRTLPQIGQPDPPAADT